MPTSVTSAAGSVSAALACAAAAAVTLYQRYWAGQRAQDELHDSQESQDGQQSPPASREDSDSELDIPDEFVDAITFEVMTDPVVLCATGQVYEYSSIRSWLSQGGKYRCPKTNQQVHDCQIVRLPWLKDRVHQWMRAHGQQPPAESPSMEELTAWHPELASYIKDMRCCTGTARATAVSKMMRLLRHWMDTATEAQDRLRQRLLRGAVLDDLVWMVRFGDEFLQGVAASTLACYHEPEELQWLACCAVHPLVALLHSPSAYAQEWSLQTLYKIVMQVEWARPAMCHAGGVQALLYVISLDRSTIEFHRDRAAVALATLAEADAAVKAWLQESGLDVLWGMLSKSTDRWERRDAAFALLALDAADRATPGRTMDKAGLERFRWCSQEWLDGAVDEPDQGHTSEELEARMQYEEALRAYQEAQAAAEGEAGGEGDQAGGRAAGRNAGGRPHGVRRRLRRRVAAGAGRGGRGVQPQQAQRHEQQQEGQQGRHTEEPPQ